MASGNSSAQLTCHQITSKHQSPEAYQSILDMCRSIFSPNTPVEDLPRYYQLSEWDSHISMPNSVIFYMTNPASNPPSRPIGFFFAVPRTQPEIGHELLHISLAGVDPESRGLGIFPLLMEKVKEHARSHGYPEMTVCTFPGRFEKMYRILGSNGWEEVAWPMKDEKVLMKLTV